MGLTASPASYAVYSSIACIYLTEKIRHSSVSKDVLKLIIVICLLYITHSRQPLIAVLIYFLLRAPMLMKSIAIVSVIALFTQVEIKFLRTIDFIIRIMQHIPGGLDNISNVKDGSLQARIHYFTSGMDYLLQNNRILFGTGINTFQSIYSMYSSKTGVAPHNDLLMFLVDFGLIRLSVGILIVVSILRKNIIIAMPIIFFYVIGLSLNNPFYYFSSIILFTMILQQRVNNDTNY